MTPYEKAIAAASEAFTIGLARQDARTPHAAAEAAWVPGGKSVEDLEQLIRADRLTRLGRVDPTDEPQPPG